MAPEGVRSSNPAMLWQPELRIPATNESRVKLATEHGIEQLCYSIPNSGNGPLCCLGHVDADRARSAGWLSRGGLAIVKGSFISYVTLSRNKMSKKTNWAEVDKRIRQRRTWKAQELQELDASLEALPDRADNAEAIQIEQPVYADADANGTTEAATSADAPN